MAHTFDVSQAEFEAKVLSRSREVPVVVDFWAAWCAPCRMLGPTLEREVEALGGRVELAKLDVDANQGLSQTFGIQGIPAVKAFRDGEVVAEFTGARDAGFVRQWLAGLSPSASVQALAKARTEAELQALVDDAEVGAKAALRLAELLLTAGRAGDAVKVLETISPRDVAATEKAALLRQQAAFLVDAQEFGGVDQARAAVTHNPDDLDARWALASALAASQDAAAALEEFLAIVSANRKYRDDGARKAMLTLFDELGPQSELARGFRRRLQVVL